METFHLNDSGNLWLFLTSRNLNILNRIQHTNGGANLIERFIFVSQTAPFLSQKCATVSE